MRVVECDTCGETISAENDDELAGRLKDHLESEHDEEVSDDDAHQTVDKEAYDAMDS
jgi:predicted small metal-binding protein